LDSDKDNSSLETYIIFTESIFPLLQKKIETHFGEGIFSHHQAKTYWDEPDRQSYPSVLGIEL